jgi:hypothetical protein
MYNQSNDKMRRKETTLEKTEGNVLGEEGKKTQF